MKTLNAVFKILMFAVLSAGTAQVHAAKLTAAHFIKTFEQMDALANASNKNDYAIKSAFMELAPRFNLAAGLPAAEFNLVIFELLNKYSRHPKLRPFIQDILGNLAQDMNIEIYNSRHRFETPIVVARALTMGFTIVLVARSGWTLYKMRHNILHAGASFGSKAIPSPLLSQRAKDYINRPAPHLPTTLPAAQTSEKMGLAFEAARGSCLSKPICRDWIGGLFAGTTVEAISLTIDSFDTQKVHPIEALRIVQAHLACDLHWNIYDYGRNWQNGSDYKTIGKQIVDYVEQIEEFQKSYSNLKNLYSSDLNSYKKYYPQSKDWWKLATTIVDENGRQCKQISTEAMKMDVKQMAKEFSDRFKHQIESDIQDEKNRANAMNDPQNDPLSGYDRAHVEREKFKNRPDQDSLHGYYEKKKDEKVGDDGSSISDLMKSLNALDNEDEGEGEKKDELPTQQQAPQFPKEDL